MACWNSADLEAVRFSLLDSDGSPLCDEPDGTVYTMTPISLAVTPTVDAGEIGHGQDRIGGHLLHTDRPRRCHRRRPRSDPVQLRPRVHRPGSRGGSAHGQRAAGMGQGCPGRRSGGSPLLDPEPRRFKSECGAQRRTGTTSTRTSSGPWGTTPSGVTHCRWC